MVTDHEHLGGELACAALNKTPSIELGDGSTAGDWRPPASHLPSTGLGGAQAQAHDQAVLVRARALSAVGMEDCHRGVSLSQDRTRSRRYSGCGGRGHEDWSTPAASHGSHPLRGPASPYNLDDLHACRSVSAFGPNVRVARLPSSRKGYVDAPYPQTFPSSSGPCSSSRPHLEGLDHLGEVPQGDRMLAVGGGAPEIGRRGQRRKRQEIGCYCAPDENCSNVWHHASQRPPRSKNGVPQVGIAAGDAAPSGLGGERRLPKKIKRSHYAMKYQKKNAG